MAAAGATPKRAVAPAIIPPAPSSRRRSAFARPSINNGSRSLILSSFLRSFESGFHHPSALMPTH